jgi:hypothetical protein
MHSSERWKMYYEIKSLKCDPEYRKDSDRKGFALLFEKQTFQRQ